MKQKKDYKKIWLAAGIVCAAAAVIAVCYIINDTMRRRDTASAYEEMASETNAVPDSIPETETGTETGTEALRPEIHVEIPEKNLDWEALHEESEDIYAWIYVPDTDIDYPVFQHPTDNSYYLNHNIDGTEGYPGCIYTEDYNAKDFSDTHTVLYGHNLKDGTMFTSLHNFEDSDLFEKDHYIFIYTEDYAFAYQIFAAYEYSKIHLLDNFDYSNQYVYENYLKSIYDTEDQGANIRLDIPVAADDQIITLSTCTAEHDAEQRYLVTGVLLNPRT